MTGLRVGTALAVREGGGLDSLREALARAAGDGLHSAWLVDPVTGLDGVSGLAIAALDVPGLEVATGVTVSYFRHPVTLAREAITADQATAGRFTLGLGLSHRVIVEDRLGVSFARSAHHMGEYLAVLMPLLRDGRVRFTGETQSAHVTLTIRPAGPLPVLLAALGPRMLELAGSLADGTVVWMTGPKTIASHIVPRISAAAARAERPPPRVVAMLPICVTDDVDATRERAARVFAGYATLPSYQAMLAREGVDGPAGIAIIGDEDEVRGQVEALTAVGVTDFVASEFGRGEDRARTRALLSALASS
jgi:5,10-methylenetetrahydromethanopterin reductase